MTVETTLTSCMQATSIGSAVYPEVAPEGKAAPYVVYTQFSGHRIGDLQGDSGLGNPHFQIDVYASTKSQTVSLKNELRDAILASATLSAVFLNDGSMYEPDTKLYRHRQDFSFWFQD